MIHFSDDEIEEKAFLEEERMRAKELQDIKKILDTPEGLQFFRRLMGYCGIFRSSYSEKTEDTLFKEGRRSVALRFLSDIGEVSPEKIKEFMVHKIKKEKN